MWTCQPSHMHYVGGLRLTASESLINRQDELDNITQEFSDVVGVDTEFYIRRTFFRIPCLCQVATSQQSYLIDLIAPLNLKAIERLMQDPTVQKVLHAAGEDLKVFGHLFGEPPSNVVDTQIAHAFVTPDDQRSYHGIVNEHLQVGLSSSSSVTTSNWNHRPLTQEQIQYAIDDVQFLVPLRNLLFERLRALGRLEWFHEEMRLFLSSQNENHGFDLVSVTGLRSLTRNEQSLVVMLAEWRESSARRNDIPRGWVASDEQLVWSVQQRRKSVAKFRRELGTRLGLRLHRKVNNLVQLADKDPKKIPHVHVESQKYNRRSSTISELKKIVRSKSEQLEMSRNLLGNQNNIVAWANHYSKWQVFPPSFGRWRDLVLGREFRQVLGLSS